jgi:XTP/dITP diphosphohydrolase
LCIAASLVALATPETTVTSCSVAFINMCASFIDQDDLSIIDIKLSQCIKILLGVPHCKMLILRPPLAPAPRQRDLSAMALSLPPGARIVAATYNAGKARELAALLEARFEVVAAGELGLGEPEETEQTFAGNALVKARAAADASGLIAFADDSGLSVAALGGAPGIYSARWAGPGRDFAHAMSLVERRLAESESDDPSAWFTCALAMAWPAGPAVVVEGRVDGTLTFPPRGDKGFGYDPIFVPQSHRRTFGEMDAAEKDELSHRARAFAKLKAALID